MEEFDERFKDTSDTLGDDPELEPLDETIKIEDTMTTATEAPAKKAATKKKAAEKKAAAPATKKKAAASKPAAKAPASKKKLAPGEVLRGRPSPFLGKKIFKTDKTENHRFQAGSSREGYFQMIKNGMKFETYMDAGGDPGSLRVFLSKKLIEIRAE